MIPFISEFLPALYSFYNTIFQPVLSLGPYIALGFFSACLAGVFSLIYWWLLDVDKQQEIKDKISEHQDKMKEARKNDKDDKASNQMKKTLELNQKMMMLNFKPMIATMVFVALIFPWLGATFAPSIQMTELDNSKFEGDFKYAGKSVELTVDNSSEPVIKLGDQKAKIGETVNAHGMSWTVTKFTDRNGGLFSTSKGTVLKMNGKFVNLPFSIPIAGEALNWLGFYIIIAMPLTIIFRKMLGI